jgi:hypothetical protein
MWRVQAVHVVNSSSRDACGVAVSRAGPLLILDNGVGSGGRCLWLPHVNSVADINRVFCELLHYCKGDWYRSYQIIKIQSIRIDSRYFWGAPSVRALWRTFWGSFLGL